MLFVSPKNSTKLNSWDLPMQMRSNIIFILFHAQLSMFAIERETICSSSHLLLEQAFVWIHISWSSLLTALPRLSAGLRSVLFAMCLWLAAFSIHCRKPVKRWVFDGHYTSLSGSSGIGPKEYFVPVIRKIQHWSSVLMWQLSRVISCLPSSVEPYSDLKVT